MHTGIPQEGHPVNHLLPLACSDVPLQQEDTGIATMSGIAGGPAGQANGNLSLLSKTTHLLM